MFSPSCGLHESYNDQIFDFNNASGAVFGEQLKQDMRILASKPHDHHDEHLHDTIAHEDELNWLDEADKKTRKNLRAKKRKKSKHEVALLEAYFEQDPDWSRKTVKALKPLLNLTVDQIYKWGYDRKHLIDKKKTLEPHKKPVRKANTMAKHHRQPTDFESVSQTRNRRDCSCEPNQKLASWLRQSDSEINHQDKSSQAQRNSCCDKSRPALNDSKLLEVLSDSHEDRHFFGTVSELFDVDYSDANESVLAKCESDFGPVNLA